jgi:transcriptional regulator with XRE-family HTH domain
MRRASTISSRVRQLRELASPPITARELDRLTGLREGHAAMLEKRVASERVEARTLHRIAEVFGVSMEWLFTGGGRAPVASDVAMPVARARRAARDKPSERPTGTD